MIFYFAIFAFIYLFFKQITLVDVEDAAEAVGGEEDHLLQHRLVDCRFETGQIIRRQRNDRPSVRSYFCIIDDSTIEL